LKEPILPPKSRLDKIIEWASPTRAAKRSRARLLTKFLDAYTGASKSRRSMKVWDYLGGDADSDILPDLPDLRKRSRDLEQNDAIASGAIKTKTTNVVGPGFSLHSRINRDVLGMSEEQADAWESKTEQEWRLFFDSKDVDITRTCDGAALTSMMYERMNVDGDSLALVPKVAVVGSPYKTRVQIVEADRLSNPDSKADTPTLAGGVEVDANGAPKTYHIAKSHPGSMVDPKLEWDHIRAFGAKTGLRNVIHLYKKKRPGQSRGVPDLHAVIEPLKMITRYSDAELMAAVVSGMFTVFIETPSGDPSLDFSNLSDETGQKASDKDYKLANGAIVGLAKGEKIHDSNPGRPNQNFDQFFQSIVKQVGMSLEIPYEILMKHFVASYSASRAAMLEFWRFVVRERKLIVDNFLKVLYEIWMHEAVAIGRISAPGFFNDPLVKKAYLGCEFRGTAKGHLDDEKEVNAAAARVKNKFSTVSQETAELTGGDWEKNHKQQVKERAAQLKDGLIVEEMTDNGIEE